MSLSNNFVRSDNNDDDIVSNGHNVSLLGLTDRAIFDSVAHYITIIVHFEHANQRNDDRGTCESQTLRLPMSLHKSMGLAFQ